MWEPMTDDQINNSTQEIKLGRVAFRIKEFHPDFHSNSGRKMAKAILTVKDAKGSTAEVYEFFNLYGDGKGKGLAHQSFKKMLTACGKLDVYKKPELFTNILGSVGNCIIGKDKEGKYLQISAYVTDNVQQQTVEHQKLSQPSFDPNVPNDDIPF